MRPNRYIILGSILLGAFGVWLSADAVGQYLNTARSFASVEVEYVEDSFVWESAEHERANAEFTLTNGSDNHAVLEHLALNLYFDGDFAGARYADWDPIDIPAGESVTIEIPFLISISEMRPQGSDAELSVRGQLRLAFDGIERDMTVPTGGTIGHVPYEESQAWMVE